MTSKLLENYIKSLRKEGKSKAEIFYEIITDAITIFYEIELEEFDGVEEP